jgi:hypothetical protein
MSATAANSRILAERGTLRTSKLHGRAELIPCERYLLGTRLWVPKDAKEALRAVDQLTPIFVQVAFKRSTPLVVGRVAVGEEEEAPARARKGVGFGMGDLRSYMVSSAMGERVSHCECSFVCLRAARAGGGGGGGGGGGVVSKLGDYVRVSFVVQYGKPLHAIIDKAYPPDSWIVLDLGSLTPPQVVLAYDRNVRSLGLTNRHHELSCGRYPCLAGCCDVCLTVTTCSCTRPSTTCRTLTVTEAVYSALVVCGNGWTAQWLEKPVQCPCCGGGGGGGGSSSLPSEGGDLSMVETHLTCSGATFMAFHDMDVVFGPEYATPIPQERTRGNSEHKDFDNNTSSSSSSPYSPDKNHHHNHHHHYHHNEGDRRNENPYKESASTTKKNEADRHRRREFAKYSPNDIYKMMVPRATSTTYFITNVYANVLQADTKRCDILLGFASPSIGHRTRGLSHGLLFKGTGVTATDPPSSTIRGKPPTNLIPNNATYQQTVTIAEIPVVGAVDSPSNVILARLAAHRLSLLQK